VLIGMEYAGARQQYFFGFGDIWIRNTAVNRAHCGAFFMIEKTDTLGAFVGRDVINILCQRRPRLAVQFRGLAAFINCIVRASRQACATIDAFLSNNRRHFFHRPSVGRRTLKLSPATGIILFIPLEGTVLERLFCPVPWRFL
jgi:hypothetical protein